VSVVVSVVDGFGGGGGGKYGTYEKLAVIVVY